MKQTHKTKSSAQSVINNNWQFKGKRLITVKRRSYGHIIRNPEDTLKNPQLLLEITPGG